MIHKNQKKKEKKDDTINNYELFEINNQIKNLQKK